MIEEGFMVERVEKTKYGLEVTTWAPDMEHYEINLRMKNFTDFYLSEIDPIKEGDLLRIDHEGERTEGRKKKLTKINGIKRNGFVIYESNTKKVMK